MLAWFLLTGRSRIARTGLVSGEPEAARDLAGTDAQPGSQRQQHP